MPYTKTNKPLIMIYLRFQEQWFLIYIHSLNIVLNFDIWILPTSGTEMKIMVSEA